MKRNRRPLSLGVVVIFLLVAVTTSPFWRTSAGSIRSGMAAYPDLRVTYAFQGIPMDRIAGALDALLPRQQPIAFGAAILEDLFLTQRFTETLYPRLVEMSSPYRLDLVPAAYRPDPREILVRFGSPERTAVLLGGPPISSTSKPVPTGMLGFSWCQLLGACAAVLGIGFAWIIILPNSARPRGAIVPSFVILLCAAFLGIVATFATAFQVSVPWTPLAVLGWLLLVGIASRSGLRLRYLTPALHKWRSLADAPESVFFGLLLLLFAARVALFPIVGWDGRSIWFFKAKQLFEHGMIARSDITQPFVRMCMPEYPLLFPASASFFSTFSGGYNERMASMAIPILVIALAGALWVLSRELMGRWIGAAFTLIAFLSVEGNLGAGYVDGFLVLFVVVEFLAFAAPGAGHAALGWIAAGGASLVKREGLPLAAATAIVAVLLLPSMGGKYRRSFLALMAVLLPATAYAVWMRAIGVHDTYYRIAWNDVLVHFSRRASIVLGGFLKVLGDDPLVNMRSQGRLAGEGLAGLMIAAAILALRRRRPAPASVVALVLGAVFVGFVFSALVLTPVDISWHVRTSIGRLLLLPSLFSVLATFLLLRDGTGSGVALRQDHPRTVSGGRKPRGRDEAIEEK